MKEGFNVIVDCIALVFTGFLLACRELIIQTIYSCQEESSTTDSECAKRGVTDGKV